MAEENLSIYAFVYAGEVLFHGPSFQVLDSVKLSRPDGVTASVAGVSASDWPTEPWVLDPAALDGALQLALLWTEEVLGSRSLPTGIGHVRWYQPPTGGNLFATLTAREATTNRVLCDVALSDAGGDLVAEISGIETHRLAGTLTK